MTKDVASDETPSDWHKQLVKGLGVLSDVPHLYMNTVFYTAELASQRSTQLT